MLKDAVLSNQLLPAKKTIDITNWQLPIFLAFLTKDQKAKSDFSNKRLLLLPFLFWECRVIHVFGMHLFVESERGSHRRAINLTIPNSFGMS